SPGLPASVLSGTAALSQARCRMRDTAGASAHGACPGTPPHHRPEPGRDRAGRFLERTRGGGIRQQAETGGHWRKELPGQGGAPPPPRTDECIGPSPTTPKRRRQCPRSRPCVLAGRFLERTRGGGLRLQAEAGGHSRNELPGQGAAPPTAPTNERTAPPAPTPP